jgi:hypothetical protein
MHELDIHGELPFASPLIFRAGAEPDFSPALAIQT